MTPHLRTHPAKGRIIANAFRDVREPAGDITPSFEALVGRAMSRFSIGRNAGRMLETTTAGAALPKVKREVLTPEQHKVKRSTEIQCAILAAILDGATTKDAITARVRRGNGAVGEALKVMFLGGMVSTALGVIGPQGGRAAKYYTVTRAGRAWLAEQRAQA